MCAKPFRWIVLSLLLAVCTGCSVEEAANKPEHHSKDRFRNTTQIQGPGPLSYLWSRFGPGAEPWATGDSQLVDVLSPNIRTREPQGPVVTWLGQSTVLIQIDQLNILTDPMLTIYAGPIRSRWFKRASPLVLSPEALPPIDLVIISHDHYDHLDLDTLVRLSGDPLILTPLRVGSLVRAKLGTRARVIEFDWWSTRRLSMGHATGDSMIEVTALPAQHGAGRTPFDRNMRLWATWAVRINGRFNFFFAGDTGYDADLFTRIGRAKGPFDLALLPIGSYLPRAHMQHVHASPAEAVLIHRAIKARHSIGIHWGTFAFSAEPLLQPALELADSIRPLTSFTTLQIGQSIRLTPSASTSGSRKE